MKIWWAITIGVVCGLLAAGFLFLVSRPPRGGMVPLLPPPTAAPYVVHITGAVQQPGVYTLPKGSRVGDAIEAAGGLSPDANEQTLNLAAFIQDGERIHVPAKESLPTSSQSGQPSDSVFGGNDGSSAGTISILVDINTAGQVELESLPGIGPVTAEKIIAFRETNGPFISIEDIQNVPGIGPVTFEKIKDLITIGDVP